MEVYNQLKSLICPFDARSDVLCSKLTKAVVAGESKRARVNIEKAVKIAKAVRNTELLVEFENR